MYFKKTPVHSSPIQRCGQPTAVTVPVEQSNDWLQPSREAAWKIGVFRILHLVEVPEISSFVYELQALDPQSFRYDKLFGVAGVFLLDHAWGSAKYVN